MFTTIKYGVSVIASPFKRLYTFFYKLYIYGKCLWNDYDFDYVYLLRIMKLKLSLMEKQFRESGVAVSSTKKAKEMKLCINLIDRIINDSYLDVENDRLEKKYGKILFGETPVELNGVKMYAIDIHRENAPQGSENYNKERDESYRAYKHSEQQRKRDIEYLFKTMSKNLERWWD